MRGRPPSRCATKFWERVRCATKEMAVDVGSDVRLTAVQRWNGDEGNEF
jgi:hypothetical protein